jgi:dihydroflavonol-4-reductase
MSLVLVTGPAGHVGANLIRALLDRGQTVRALVHRDQQALDGLDVDIVYGDITDPQSLPPAFAGVELVFHAAGHVSISWDEKPLLNSVNVLGAYNVAEACLQAGVRRLVHFSSVETLLGNPSAKVVDESCAVSRMRGVPPYARSKAAGESKVRQAMARGLDAIILYPSAILGPYDHRLGFPNAGLLALANGSLWALVRGGFDWVDVRDLVQGAIAAADRAPAGGRYILSGHWASLRDLALLAQGIDGVRVPRLVFPVGLARLGAPFATALSRLSGRRPLYTSAALYPLGDNRRISHARATRDLGYRPRPLAETVLETLQWLDTRGLLTHRLAPLPQHLRRGDGQRGSLVDP